MWLLYKGVRKIKKFITILSSILLVIFILFVFLYSYAHIYEGNRPIDQPDKRWVSEDGDIMLYTDKTQRTTGSMIIDGKEIEILFRDGEGKNIYIFPNETKVQDIKKCYELWVGDFILEDEFTITVKKTTYFKVGQKITFYRVDDEEDSSK